MQFEPVGLEPQGPDKKRLFLAVSMMMLMWFGYVEWVTQNTPAPTAPAASSQADAAAVANEAKVAPKADVIDVPKQEEAVASAATPASAEVITHAKAQIMDKAMGKKGEMVQVGYDVSFTNQGGQILGYELTGYKAASTETSEDDAVKWVDLVHGSVEDVHLMGLASRGGDVVLRPKDTYRLVSNDSHRVTYERLTHEGVKITRTYTFGKNDFTYKHNIELENVGQTVRELQLDLQLAAENQGDSGGGMMNPMVAGFGAACHGNDHEHHRVETADLEDGPLEIKTPLLHVAMDDQYFLHALMPNPVDKATCKVALSETNETPGFILSLSYPAFKIRPGEKISWGQEAFAGPKELDTLQALGNDLDQNVDFGWFGAIARPMLWVLMQNYSYTGNFGLAIILLTLLVKLITFPLTQKSYVSMQQMKTIAPELKALQKKYAHDRQLQGQKQMELYREKGINPMAGCLPMFIQMPIWIALYRTLWGSVELYQQPFFGWLTDLTMPDPLYVLPIAMGVTMAIQTAFQPAPEDQPQMKYIMWGMPIFLTVIMISLPAGLSLYMLTNNLLTIVQQYYIKRKYT